MSPRATTENARRKTAVQKRLAMAKKALLAVAGVRLKEENITFKSVCIDAVREPRRGLVGERSRGGQGSARSRARA